MQAFNRRRYCFGQRRQVFSLVLLVGYFINSAWRSWRGLLSLRGFFPDVTWRLFLNLALNLRLGLSAFRLRHLFWRLRTSVS